MVAAACSLKQREKHRLPIRSCIIKGRPEIAASYHVSGNGFGIYTQSYVYTEIFLVNSRIRASSREKRHEKSDSSFSVPHLIRTHPNSVIEVVAALAEDLPYDGTFVASNLPRVGV